MRLILCCLACVVSLCVSAIAGHFSTPSRWEYSVIAEHLLQGQGTAFPYHGTVHYFYGPPLYPILLAGVLWMTHHQEGAMVILQALLFAWTCLVVYQIAQTFFGKTGAILAAALAALHPGALIYVGKLHPQTLDTLLIMLTFLLLLRLHATARLALAFGGGLVAGLAILSRGTVGPCIGLWILWFVWKARRQWVSAIRVVAGVAVGIALILAPVLIAGWMLYGKPIPLRTDTGVNLWYGNHPGASGSSYTFGPSPVEVASHIPQALTERLPQMNEVEQDRAFLTVAWEFIRDHPAETTRLFFKKLFYFWWFSPTTGLLYPRLWTRVYQVYYAIILVFAWAGFLILLKSRGPSGRDGAILSLLIAGGVSVAQALFYVEGRHRWQIEPLLLVLAAGGFLSLLRWAKSVVLKKV